MPKPRISERPVVTSKASCNGANLQLSNGTINHKALTESALLTSIGYKPLRRRKKFPNLHLNLHLGSQQMPERLDLMDLGLP